MSEKKRLHVLVFIFDIFTEEDYSRVIRRIFALTHPTALTEEKEREIIKEKEKGEREEK